MATYNRNPYAAQYGGTEGHWVDNVDTHVYMPGTAGTAPTQDQYNTNVDSWSATQNADAY